MKKTYYLFFLLVSFLGYGQSIIWQKNFGTSGSDYSTSVRKTTDGGYITAGYSYTSVGGYYIQIVKFTSTGIISWQKNLSGNSSDWVDSIQQTTDGGYIIAGHTFSSASGDVTTTNHGGLDVWVVKLTSTGIISWQKSLGGNKDDYASSIQQTTDGGYILVGSTISSANGDVTGIIHGAYDIWVVKLTSTGTINWQKNIGGSENEGASFIQQTTDGGYIIAGTTNSSASGDVTGINHGPSYTPDTWIIKLDSSGNINWQKNLGGDKDDYASSIQQTTDGGYIVAGYTNSSASGDVVGISRGDFDMWIVKLSSTGAISWQKNIGGNMEDKAYSIQQTTDGGYIVAGHTNSSANGDVVGISHGGSDMWIVKLTPTGSINWQKNLGGNDGEYAYSVQQTSSGIFVSDNKYIILGYTGSSANGDVTGANLGATDKWIVNLSDVPPVIVGPENKVNPE